MESSELRDLLEILSKINFVEFEMEREGFRLRLLRASVCAPAPPGSGLLAQPTAPPQSGPVVAPGIPSAAAEEGLLVVTSPIVGTFYRAATPEAQALAEVGGRVKKGQVLCIVEAMKLMNEIESEVEGEVVEVLVANGQPVEYGEILFRIRPIA